MDDGQVVNAPDSSHRRAADLVTYGGTVAAKVDGWDATVEVGHDTDTGQVVVRVVQTWLDKDYQLVELRLTPVKAALLMGQVWLAISEEGLQ